MRISFLVLISILLSAAVPAQKTIRITSNDDQQPVAYASIINHANHQFANTLEDGTCSIDFKSGDTISISHIGFEKKLIVAGSELNLFIVVNRKPLRLAEIKLNSCVRSQSVIRQNLDADTGRRFGGVGAFCQNENAQFAIKLIPGCSNAELSKLYFWLHNTRFVPKSQDTTPVLIYFYFINPENQLPGEPVVDRPISYLPKKMGKQVVDLSSLRIVIPEDGIWVGFSFLRRSGKDYVRTIEDSLGNKTTERCWGASFDGVFSRGYSLCFYRWSTGNWIFPRYGFDEKNVHGTIKLAFEMMICNDQAKENDLRTLLPARKFPKEEKGFYRY